MPGIIPPGRSSVKKCIEMPSHFRCDFSHGNLYHNGTGIYVATEAISSATWRSIL